MSDDERENCPAEHLTFSRDDTIVRRGLASTPGALDLRMDCADCGMWAIVRYIPGYSLFGLHDRMFDIAPGRHAAPFEAYVRAIRATEDKRKTS